LRPPARVPAPGRLRAAVAAAIALVLCASPSPGWARAARAGVARQLAQAEARFRSLTESPTARRRLELWDRAAARFRAIVDADPSGAYAADASYMIAEVHHERFHTFHRPGDLDRAIEAYEHLLDRYPRSRTADDALVHLGEIHYYQLGDVEQALRFYKRAIREYPDGNMTDRARVRAAAIEGSDSRPRATVDSGEAALGERPLPGRPLSSPGAVIGGRAAGGPAGGPERSEGRENLRSSPARSAGREGLIRSEGRQSSDMRGLVDRAPGLEETEPPREEGTAPPPAREEEKPGPRVTEKPEEPEEPEPSRVMPQPAEVGGRAPVTVPARPLNPLLEEGPIPLKTPADRLPVLSPAGPRSQVAPPEVPRAARADCNDAARADSHDAARPGRRG